MATLWAIENHRTSLAPRSNRRAARAGNSGSAVVAMLFIECSQGITAPTQRRSGAV